MAKHFDTLRKPTNIQKSNQDKALPTLNYSPISIITSAFAAVSKRTRCHISLLIRQQDDHISAFTRLHPGKGVVLFSFVVAFAGLIVSVFVPRRRVWVRAEHTDAGPGGTLRIEYGLLARGEDPRLVDEADKLTDIFADQWALELSDSHEATADNTDEGIKNDQ